MPESAPFSFSELGESIHKFTVDIFGATDDGFTKKVAEDGLTREQAAALLLGDAMRVYTQERSATAGESAKFNLDPDWKYVRRMLSDLLTEIYVEQTPAYEAEAVKRDMTLHHLAASILLTAFKQYMETGKKHGIRIGSPEKHLNDHAGLEDD
jgi:hypothetical protein